MQYEITLPADYDMEVIRQRVTTRGHLTDGFAGLGLKAYCIRERTFQSEGVNEYAPFYLWASAEGMSTFLLGPGFRGLCDSFGRPRVRHWTGIACEPGPACMTPPAAASRGIELLRPDEDVPVAVERAMVRLADRASTRGVHSTALALDPLNWELVHFTLWEQPTSAITETRYEVLHVSAPGLPDILARPAVGRLGELS